MPTEMTDEELEEASRTASEVATYEHGDPEVDEYFTATLLKTPSGRHFRRIDSAGMTADVTAGTGEWLSPDEVDDWTAIVS